MAAQYVQDDSGATFIPATQRPDGTWRKARRVKEGYVPQEEMPLYESKGKQWAKNKPTLPPGLHPDDIAKVESMRSQGCLANPASSSLGNSHHIGTGSITNPPNSLQGLSKSAKKNAKRKGKKKEKHNQLLSQDINAAIVEQMQDIHISNNNNKQMTESQSQITNNVHSAETTKRLKNLRKKLREIEILKEKMASGVLPNPEKDQLEKINRQQEIEQEIEDLELSED